MFYYLPEIDIKLIAHAHNIKSHNNFGKPLI